MLDSQAIDKHNSNDENFQILISRTQVNKLFNLLRKRNKKLFSGINSKNFELSDVMRAIEIFKSLDKKGMTQDDFKNFNTACDYLIEHYSGLHEEKITESRFVRAFGECVICQSSVQLRANNKAYQAICTLCDARTPALESESEVIDSWQYQTKKIDYWV